MNFKIKKYIESYLKSLNEYEDITLFFIFLIEVKDNNFLDKNGLYNILLGLSKEIKQESIFYAILTDTMDYFVDFHPELLEGSDEYCFIKSLNT